MNIAVVIPFFNEKNHIRGLLDKVSRYELPIIAVNDGSTDGVEKLSDYKYVTFVNHSVNLGKGSAMKTGAEYAFSNGFDAIIFMDADNQHNPNDLTAFVGALQENKYDVVFGSRNLKKGTPFIRKTGNQIASKIINLLFNIYISDPICGYRAITKKGYKKIIWESQGYGVETEMIANVAKQGIKYTEIPVDTIYHDSNKGVTILDAFGVLGDVLKWRLTK